MNKKKKFLSKLLTNTGILTTLSTVGISAALSVQSVSAQIVVMPDGTKKIGSLDVTCLQKLAGTQFDVFASLDEEFQNRWLNYFLRKLQAFRSFDLNVFKQELQGEGMDMRIFPEIQIGEQRFNDCYGALQGFLSMNQDKSELQDLCAIATKFQGKNHTNDPAFCQAVQVFHYMAEILTKAGEEEENKRQTYANPLITNVQSICASLEIVDSLVNQFNDNELTAKVKRDFGEVDYTKCIGRGCFGKAYLTTDGKYVAKVSQESDYAHLQQLLGALPENFRGVARPFYSVEQYGSQVDFMKRYTGSSEDINTNEMNSTQIIYAIVTAFNSLARIHERGLIHNDLHARNIFFKKEKNYKVIMGDFGMITSIFDESYRSQSTELRLFMKSFLTEIPMKKSDKGNSVIKEIYNFLKYHESSNNISVSVYDVKDKLKEIVEAHGIALESLEPEVSKQSKNHIPLKVEMSRHSKDSQLRQQLQEMSFFEHDGNISLSERSRKIDFHKELDEVNGL